MQTKHQGMVIPTALLIAMVVFLIATGLTAQISYNLSLTGLEAQKSRRYFMAQGAANEFIDKLSSTPALLSHTEANPYTGIYDDLSYEVWSELDPVHPLIRTVVARAYPTGEPQSAQVFLKVVQEGADTSGLVATNVPDNDVNSLDPVYLSASVNPSWTSLPMPDRIGIDGATGLPIDPDTGPATCLIFGGGDQNGHLFFIYPPALEKGLDGVDDTADDDLFGAVALNALCWQMNSLESLGPIVHKAHWIMEEVVPDGGTEGLTLSRHAVLLQFDIASGDWTPIMPPPLNYEFDAGSETFVPTVAPAADGPFHVQGLAGPLAATDTMIVVPVYKTGPDLVMKYEIPTTTWSALPPVPDRSGEPTDVSHVAVAGTEIYAIAYPDKLDSEAPKETPAIYRLAGANWAALPPVPANKVVQNTLVEVSGEAPSLGCLAGGLDGSLYVMASGGPGGETIYKFAGGAWTPLVAPFLAEPIGPGPRAVYSDIGVDATGTLVARAPHYSEQDKMYAVRPSDYWELPDLPGGESYSAQMIGGAAVVSSQRVYRPTASY